MSTTDSCTQNQQAKKTAARQSEAERKREEEKNLPFMEIAFEISPWNDKKLWISTPNRTPHACSDAHCA